jgi:sec-independent protein translocase protein TatA
MMDWFSIWHLLVVLAVVLMLLGGRERISKVMRDFAEGIDAFKRGLSGDKDDSAPRPPRRGLSPGLLLMAIVALAISIAAYVKTLQQN